MVGNVLVNIIVTVAFELSFERVIDDDEGVGTNVSSPKVEQGAKAKICFG